MLIDVNGARLAVELVGQGSPVVLVHAGLCDRRMWRRQVAALAPRHRVVTCDLRGHGDSPPTAGDFAHAADLRALLDALQLARADVVGASLGGGAAIDLALAAPERVGKLVLVAPAIGGYRPSARHRELVAAVDDAYRAGGVAAACELELRMWVDGPSRRPDEVSAELRELVRVMNTRVLEHEAAQPDAHAAWLEPPASARLEEVRAATLVVDGDLDLPDPRERSALAAARIPGARRVTLAGTAHLPSLEQPERFNALLLAFLGDAQE